MGEAVYFGVVMRFNREEPQLFYDRVPHSLTLRGSPLVYCTRIDTLPDGERLSRVPLAKLFAAYQQLKKSGKLPPQNRE